MNTLLDKIQKGIVEAIKSGDELTRDTLRSIKAALERYTKDSRKPLDDKAEQSILNTLTKQRQEAADAFTKGNRPESAEKELKEKSIIESYLPRWATAEEVENAFNNIVDHTKMEAGRVTKLVQSQLTGLRVDAKALYEKAKEKCNGIRS